MDPVIIFLLVSVPILAGTTVHLYLNCERTAALLRREYLVKWCLHGFTEVCRTETDLRAVREGLAESLMRLVEPRAVRIYEPNPRSDRLELLHQIGLKNDRDEAQKSYVCGEGIPGWVMQNQKPAILNDLSLGLRPDVERWVVAMGFKSYAAIPLMGGEKTLGLITMYSPEPNFFEDSKVLLAQILSNLYGLCLDNHRKKIKCMVSSKSAQKLW